MVRIALLTCFVSLVARAEPKVAYVDVQRALWEVEEGKEAKARVQAIADAAQKDIDRDRTAVMKEKDDFEKQVNKMSPADRNQRGTELEKKMIDFNNKLQKSGQEVEAEQRREVDAILAKMNPIIATIAERESLSFIFDKSRSGLLFAPTTLDLTNELIRIYNEKYKVSKPAKESKPAAAAPATKSPPATKTPPKK
jgi:outer membrane protein